MSNASTPTAVTARPATRPRGSLAAEEVIDEAVALIRAGGLEAFSMRKLADALGVTPMTIYLRFDNKDDLLLAVAEHMLGRLDVPEVEGSWDDRVVALAVAIRSHLIDSRAVLLLLGASDGLGLAMLDATEAGLVLMEEAGFAGADAVDAFRTVFWHAVGAAMVADTIAADQIDVIRRASPAATGARLSHPLGSPPDGPLAHPRFAALIEHFTTPDADLIFERSTRALATGLARSAGRTTPAGTTTPSRRTTP